jgi:adenylate kinase
MRLILLGPPGSGKGTQAKLLSRKYDLAHISTGDILREAKEARTPAGRHAEPYMVSGRLVPDDIVNDIVAERFRQADRTDKFVMDGYPRTLPQAQAFDQLLREQALPLTAVIVLEVSDNDIVARLGGRRYCPNCKATYHIEFNAPSVAGQCDKCGTALVQRDDDKEATVRTRLKVYHENTETLIDHYRRQGLVREVFGVGDIETVYANLTAVL